jgi:hypothetical protein
VNTTESIVTGVVSGLLTGALVFLLSRIFQSIVLPWYRELTYTGIDLSGTWEVHPDPPHTRHLYIELVQRAGVVSGTATHTAKRPNENGGQTRTYRLHGEVRDRFVWIRGHSTDPRRIGVLCYLLESIGDGNTLRGSLVMYDITQSRVVSDQCVASRK